MRVAGIFDRELRQQHPSISTLRFLIGHPAPNQNGDWS